MRSSRKEDGVCVKDRVRGGMIFDPRLNLELRHAEDRSHLVFLPWIKID